MNNTVLQGIWPALDQDGHKVGGTPMLTQRKFDISLAGWIIVIIAALGCFVIRAM